jgi:hypothetical protein
MNCYSCKFRLEVPGSAHSRCGAIKDKEKEISSLEIALLLGTVSLLVNEEVAISLNPHGVKSGWANWPLDFDPVWIDKCLIFKNKEDDKQT